LSKTSPWLQALTDRERDYYVTEVIRRFFDKADEDYVAARILLHHVQLPAFFWNAQQSLEKYLKAALLLRGQSIRSNHDLKWHFKKLSQQSDLSFPSVLEAPKGLKKLPLQQDEKGHLRPWPFRVELTQFVSALSRQGGPASRYNERDQDFEYYDLVRFDLVAAHFRKAALDTPNFRIHREIKDPLADGGQGYFGKVALNSDTFEIVLRNNLAFGEPSEPAENAMLIAMRSNEGRQKILSRDPAYNRALSFLECKISDQ